MNTLENMNDDMLVKYLLGEASEAEQSEVAAWIAARDENRKYFDHFRLIWDQSKELAAKSTVNTDAAWQRFVQRTEADAHTGHTARTIPLFQRTWLRVAAVLVLCSGLGLTLYNMNNGGVQSMIVSSGGTTLTDTLPDGSVVVLNKNSSIAYNSKFIGNERNVTLKGEAFFTVTPDKSRPFIIDANNVSVTVVGTTFNVKTTTERTEVIVETGIVQVAKKQNHVRVMPNQKVTATGDKDLQTETNQDELYNYYRTHEFVCNATPLSKLVPVLNEAFNVHIILGSNEIGDMKLSYTSKNESLDTILEVIRKSLDITIERNGTDIILK